jgi:AcrR family transcriptional regulator
MKERPRRRSKGEKPKDYALFATLFPLEPSESQRRQVEIAEAAIRIYVREGVERATFERIARESGCSRPLVMHYFPERDSIFQLAARYVRASFQALAVEAIRAEATPVGQLRAYTLSTFDWVEKSPDHAKVWMLFFYYCGIRKEYRDLNTDLVRMGHDRIAALLARGKDQGVFACEDPVMAAKQVQLLISGAVVAAITERVPGSMRKLRELTVQGCLALAGARP